MRLSKLIEECKLPDAVKDFLETDIFINAINYYEVKKWAAKQKEDVPEAITYQKVMDKCKEYEATVKITYAWQVIIPNYKQHTNKGQPV